VRVPAGQRTAAAVIHRQEQVWTVVQGVGCFHRAGEDGDHMGATLLSPGDAVFIPPGYTHWVENNGQEDLVFLCCSSPPQAAKRAAQTTVREGDTQMANLFEYKILVSDSDDETDEETLNTLGEQGWELVNAVADVRAGEEDGDTEGDDQNVPVTVFYFKRVRD
jgi:mannose-6-phosphate isomerase-like protein (cupin superfamily)